MSLHTPSSYSKLLTLLNLIVPCEGRVDSGVKRALECNGARTEGLQGLQSKGVGGIHKRVGDSFLKITNHQFYRESRPFRVSASQRAAECGPVPRSVGVSEVHLFELVEHGPGAKQEPINVGISEAVGFFRSGTFKVDGHTYKVNLEEASKDAIKMGMAVRTFASPAEGGCARVPVRLYSRGRKRPFFRPRHYS
jgi:hypothetical protein